MTIDPLKKDKAQTRSPLPSRLSVSEQDAPPRFDARSLLDGEKEAILILDGEQYRLRITSKSKLILTK